MSLPTLRNKQNELKLKAVQSKRFRVMDELETLQRNLEEKVESSRVRYLALQNTLAIYENDALPLAEDTATASLSSYGEEAGHISEALRDQLAILDIQLEMVDLRLESHLVRAELDYLIGETVSYEE